MQMAIVVTSRMENPPKNVESLQFVPRFQALPLLFLRNNYLTKNLISILGNISDSLFIEVTVIWDADKTNQDKIAAHLCCVYSSYDRNNMKSLQLQIHFIINHWGPTPTL